MKRMLSQLLAVRAQTKGKIVLVKIITTFRFGYSFVSISLTTVPVHLLSF